MKKLFLLGILSMLFLAACSGSVEEDTVKIGWIGPLSGGAAFFGTPMKQATELSVERINAEGGIQGRSIEIIYEDGECSGKKAVSSLQKLINVDKVNVVIGGLCSGETLAAAPLAEENQVILFSAGSGSPDITNAGEFIFRNFPSDATSASKVGKIAFEEGDVQVAVLREQTDYAAALARVFTENFEGEITTEETFPQDTTDYRNYLTKIVAGDATGIYIATSSETSMTGILQQMGELGVDLQIYTNEFASSSIVLDEYAEQIEGAVFAEPKFDEHAPLTAEMLSTFKERYGEIEFIPFYVATAYDAPKVLADVMQDCGEDTACIKDELYNVKDWQGTAGELTLNNFGDPEFTYVAKTIEGGEAVLLE